MIYDHDIDKANEVASAAMEKLRALNIAMTPDNYELFYVYYASINPKLREELQGLLKSGDVLTPDILQALYRKYISEDRYQDNYKKAGDQIHSTIQDVSGLMQNVKSASDDYAQSLESVNEKLSSDAGPEEIQEIVKSVVEDTSRILDNNRQLQEQLEMSERAMDELKRDLDQIRKEAMTDGLTGLANRKMLDEEMQNMVDHACETGESFVFMLLDIDHFKAFNDNYGHQVGDQVLRLVAKTLVDGVKGQDLVGRYGGEEFVILLPNSSIKAGEIVGENLRKSVADKEVINRSTGDRLGQITLSAGVAQFMAGDTLEKLIERADGALYTAKNNGRNQVVASNSPAGIEQASA